MINLGIVQFLGFFEMSSGNGKKPKKKKKPVKK